MYSNSMYFYLLALLPSLYQFFFLFLGNYFIGLFIRIFVDIGIPVWYFQQKKKALLATFRGVPLSSLLFWSISTIIVLSVFLIALTPLFPVNQITRALSNLYDVTPVVYLFVALSVGIVNPFFEEFFWRSFLYGESKSIWIGALFGLHHIVILYTWVGLPLSLLAGFLLGIVGIFFNYLYKLHNSVTLPLVVHIVADIVIVVYGYWFLFIQ